MVDIFKEKYGRRIAKGSTRRVASIPYSAEYKKFKRAETSTGHKLYEKLCNFSAKIYKPTLSKEKQEELGSYIYVAHIDTTPEGAVAFSRLATIISTFLFLFLSIYLVMYKAMFFSLFLLVIPLIVLFMLSGVPKSLFKKWQARASDQIILAVLYIVISMKQERNLERAVHLAAERLPPPLSLDFSRILWQFESGTYSTVSEAMDAYLILWKGKQDEFVDAMNLVESALMAPSAEKADNMFDKAVDVALEGIQDRMMHFAHNLQGPIKTLHMMGIVLPVLLLVMLPLLGSFLNVGVVPLIVIFNILLPLAVYLIARSILSKRPGGVSKTSKLVFKQKLAARKTAGIALAVLIFLLFSTPFALLMYTTSKAYPGQLSNVLLFGAPKNPNLANYILYASIGVVMGIGLGIAFYYWFTSKKALKLKQQVERIEDQFSAAVFQLGSRIGEGTPTELAFGKVSAGMKGTAVGDMFALIDYNLRTKGMNLEDAMFNKSSGAAWVFPSGIIRSIFRLLAVGAKKGLKAVANTLLILSRYLRDLHKVSERMKDLLADTISAMQLQASFLVAVITSIVVSLSVLIVQVLIQLAFAFNRLTELESGSYEYSEGLAGGAGISGLLDLFNPQNAIAPYVFQLVAGIYIIIIVILISYLLARIVYGQDEVNRKYLTAQNLFKSMLVYGVIAILGSKFLGDLAQKVTVGMVGAG